MAISFFESDEIREGDTVFIYWSEEAERLYIDAYLKSVPDWYDKATALEEAREYINDTEGENPRRGSLENIVVDGDDNVILAVEGDDVAIPMSAFRYVEVDPYYVKDDDDRLDWYYDMNEYNGVSIYD